MVRDHSYYHKQCEILLHGLFLFEYYDLMIPSIIMNPIIHKAGKHNFFGERKCAVYVHIAKQRHSI